MKSNSEIKKIVKELTALSLNDKGNVSKQSVKEILSLISDQNGKEDGLRIEPTQVIALLKGYKRSIANALVKDTIRMSSAISLSEHEKEEKIQELKKVYGKNIVLFDTNKDIIAGIKVQAGWNVVEISVKQSLDTLIS